MPILAADEQHAFSSGTLSERGDASARLPQGGPRPQAPRSESVYFESRTLPDQRHIVIYQPDGVWDSFHATREHAQNHALALNEWLAARPRESDALPFFNPVIEDVERCSTERLFRILDAQLGPETREIA